MTLDPHHDDPMVVDIIEQFNAITAAHVSAHALLYHPIRVNS
jgi:hypothetical protein